MLSVVRALKQVGDASVRPIMAITGVSMAKRKRRNEANGVFGGVFHTVAACILGHVQFLKKSLHQWSWDWSSRDNSRAQIRSIKSSGLGDAEDGLEHGGNTMQGRTFLVGDSMHHGLGIKSLAGEDDL
jgi:hypothetical protein